MVGRQYETGLMQQLLESGKAEMLAITGRRRVGKTYLIKQVYKDRLVFDFTGTQYATRTNQLAKFADKLSQFSQSPLPLSKPHNWAEAFTMLKKYLETQKLAKQKKVIFFDELPWIGGHRSGFLQEFGYWWNDWASNQNLVVVICGSATSWMLEKILNNKGGLHNRVTRRISLKPFTLGETSEYLKSKNINLQHYEIMQIYMALGGIPHYLNEVVGGESAIQNINRLCIEKNGLLRNEFDNLYAALFDHAENHIAVIKTLSEHPYGMTRQEIITVTKFSDGGGLSKILGELESSDFIISLSPFGKSKKDILYRLSDQYSLFYLKFIQGKKVGEHATVFTNVANEPYKIWRGYAFENICILHIEAIKSALGIAGIQTSQNSFYLKGSEKNKGFQIDLLIDRADNSINICEIKFYNDTIRPDAEFADQLRQRRELFREASGTKKQLFNTIITTFGVEKNAFALSQVDNIITADALFTLKYLR